MQFEESVRSEILKIDLFLAKLQGCKSLFNELQDFFEVELKYDNAEKCLNMKSNLDIIQRALQNKRQRLEKNISRPQLKLVK